MSPRWCGIGCSGVLWRAGDGEGVNRDGKENEEKSPRGKFTALRRKEAIL